MQKFDYDVSVIIPVYNVEDYIEETIDSLVKQNYDFSKIEIILIEDGSKDNSLEICKKIEAKYNNVKLLVQVNSGVSCARNNGIKNASGKYIMLLDSDDTLEANTIKNLVNFFDCNYDDVDIVTYPLVYNRYGRLARDIRYSAYDKGTGIYDVNEYIYLNQSTVNIMIKNEGKNNNLYNVNMKLSEDQNFDTQLIMRKEKIGFVEEAAYYYRRYDASVSLSRNNPYYCFEQIMDYNESLLDTYIKDGKPHKYVQSLVVNTLKWRMKSDQLFPYYLTGKEYDKAVNRIKKLAVRLDVDVIMGCDSFDYYHRLYLLKFAGHKFNVKFNKKIEIYCDDKLIDEVAFIDGIVSKLKLRKNKLFFTGDLISPIFDFKSVELFLEKNFKFGEKKVEKIELKSSNMSYYKAAFKTTTAYRFDLSFDVENLEGFRLYFKCDEKVIPIAFTFNKFTSNNFVVNKLNILYSRKDLRFKIRKNNIVNFLRSRVSNARKCFSKNKKACLYRLMYYFYPCFKNVWLYTDRGSTVDNAYNQFIHDFDKKDNVKRYYISTLKQKERNTYFSPEQQKYLVRQGSLKHKMLYLKCSKIVSSFGDLQVYCPFNKSISLYNDLTNYDFIYLQHGILHASLLKMYGKEFTEIDKFVISTNFEKENLINKYSYNENDLALTGMPRLNMDLDVNSSKNKILFAPSWRKYLIGGLINNKRQLKKREFLDSNFYKEIYSFLHSRRLNNFLEKNDYVLEFQLHPIFKEYTNLFDLNDLKNVKIKSDKADISEYMIFITDFSSFQFDFVKIGRPIIYYMPDFEEFNAGLHTYRELDLKYEDAFGKLCVSSDELIKEIEKIIKNGCEVEKKYQKRMSSFFLENIDNPCEDIYNAVKNM